MLHNLSAPFKVHMNITSHVISIIHLTILITSPIDFLLYIVTKIMKLMV